MLHKQFVVQMETHQRQQQQLQQLKRQPSSLNHQMLDLELNFVCWLRQRAVEFQKFPVSNEHIFLIRLT